MSQYKILNEIAQLILNLFPFELESDDTITLEHHIYSKIKVNGNNLELYENSSHFSRYTVPHKISLLYDDWKRLLTEALLIYE